MYRPEGTTVPTSASKPLAGRRVVVTGANGFVGRAVARWFSDRGADVVGCIRRRDARDELPIGAEPALVEDPLNSAVWAAVLEGADAVVHLVARTHMTRESADALPEYRRTNVGITRALLAAAIGRQVPRFVFTSSIKAVGEGDGSPYSENATCRPLDPYGATKREAELLVRGECHGTRTTQTIVRPPLVYGPGVKGNFAKLIRAVDRGLPLPLGRVNARRSIVGVRNLADALGTAAVHPDAADRLFHVADPGPAPTVRDLVTAIARQLGRSPRLLPVPEGVLRVAGRVFRRSDAIDRLVNSLEVDATAIRRRLQWRAPFDFEDGLRETVAWHRRLAEGTGRAA